MTTGESWLFLFSAISAITGLLPMVESSINLTRRLLGSREQHPNRQITAKTRASDKTAIRISRPRFAAVVVLLLTSAGLSVGGFVSSIQKEEPLKQSLRPENIE